MKKSIIFIAIIAAGFCSVKAQQPTSLNPGFKNETNLSKNQKDIYSVSLNEGECAVIDFFQKGVDIVVEAFDSEGQKIKSFDSPNGNSGPEPVKIIAGPAGVYRLEVHPFDNPTGMSDAEFAGMQEKNQGVYEISSVKIYSAEEYRRMLDEEIKNDNRIIGWLAGNTITFNGVNAGSGFEDLQPLKQILKDVKYVGLGEATHGTREFFRMKHRMLEFLVKEMGFTVFAIEASFAGCKNINDYVMYGKGDAYTALASQGFWTWDTEEVIDMIEWMRTYNQTVTGVKKVMFAGIDIQINTKGGGVQKIREYLQKVDTARFNEMNAFLDKVESISESSQKDSARTAYKNFLAFFVMSKGNYVQKSSAAEYDTALEYCRVLGQLIDAYFMDKNDPKRQEREWRDYYMASNFFNLVQNEKPGTKIVLWAHNGHVSHDPVGYVNGGLKPLGSYLKEAFGEEYYVFGFAFNKGGFQAFEYDSTGKSLGLQEFIANPAREKSLDWYFAQTNKPMFIFNFRDKNLPGFMNEFVNKPIETRGFGAVAYRQFVDQTYGKYRLSSDYDGIIFINETHRALPTKKGNVIVK